MEEKPKSIREWSEYYFDQMYEYARKYSDYYGSLDINEKFATDDGVNYKEDGKVKLGRWVHRQIESVKPDSSRGMLLTRIGMVWNTNDNKKLIHDLCRKYIINIEINYMLLNRLSAQEFEAKINYCIANDIPIMNSWGELNEVFYLQDEQLKEKYGVTKGEIFDNYYDNSKERSLKRNYD